MTFSDDDATENHELEHRHPEVTKTLDSLMFFLGNNTPAAGNEKIDAVQKLRRIIETGRAPSAAAIEAFALQAGKREKVAGQLRKMYEKLLEGGTFLDHNRRPI